MEDAADPERTKCVAQCEQEWGISPWDTSWQANSKEVGLDNFEGLLHHFPSMRWCMTAML